MIARGRRITTDDKKANLSMDHYASVSKLHFSKEDKITNILDMSRTSKRRHQWETVAVVNSP